MKIIVENKQLNEVFSPSMPEWLQARILQGNSSYKKMSQLNQKGVDTNFYNRTSNRSTDSDLGQGLHNFGIDYANAEYISGEVPTSSRDPRLKEPNLPIFLLQDGGQKQVYIPGVNGTEL